ncbi:hypothetical protein ILUMI_03364 [Ignelater luminosus]|uniref:UBA domain-containing protein n=1 Tax=Ignelater luminosus TaxID=2038154 RepID=A0A8K0DB53_IGNLU|nr:hypothetical protein ILUMI_03364 [Ignelater luminosus]
MKIKEKKLALMRSNDEDNRSSGSSKSRPIGLPLSDTELLMDASPMGQHELVIPHMAGGETYQQEWHIVNTGDLQWTENTELRYAWGSEALKPLEKSVPCPPLSPGEKGVVSIYLEIPKKAGNYESYWHFYHDGRRFGHWLGCRVIVDPPPVKLSSPPIDILTSETEQSVLLRNWTSTPKKLDTKENKEFETPNIDGAELNKFCSLSVREDLQEDGLKAKINEIKSENKKVNTADNLMTKYDEINVTAADLEDLKLYDSNSSSDSDNQSIISIADSNSSAHSPSDEFVVVPIMSECLDVDEKTDMEEKKLSSGNLCIPVCSNIKLEKIDNAADTVDTVNKNDNEQNFKKEEVQSINDLGYAYVNVDGQKIAVPKYLLRADYLATAEEAPTPSPVLLNMLPLTASSPTPTIDSLAPTINTSTTPSIIMPKEENKDVILLDNSTIRNSEESQINGHEQQDSISNTIKNTNAECPLENGESSCMNSSRVFMFPSNIPGFEVFPTPKSFAGSLPTESHISNNATNQSSHVFNDTLTSSSSHPSGQFYQYGYCSSPVVTPAANTENIFGYSYSYPYSHYYPYPASWYAAALSQPLIENKVLNKYPHLYFDCREPHHNTSRIPSQEVETNEVMNESHDIPMNTAATKASSPIQPMHPLHAAIPIDTCKRTSPVTVLPNTLVSGAVNVASSAINTARSVINMFSPPVRQQQEQLQEQWDDESLYSPNERALRKLHEMGFWDLNLNKTLLARYNNDLTRVITELLNN